MATISDHDREMARRLPDDFLQASGDPVERVVDLVNRHWGSYEAKQCTELAQALVAILEELSVTDGHRNFCEEVVVGWLSKQ